MIEPSLIFGTITATGTFITIAVIVWNDGRTKGQIKQQIIALQADVTRQNINDSALSDKIAHTVDKADCIRAHDDLNTTISGVNERLNTYLSERQQSEDRILAAIRQQPQRIVRERR